MKPIFILTIFFSFSAISAPKLITLKTRPKVKIRFLLEEPRQLRKGTIVLFAGGPGGGGFGYKKKKIKLGRSFLPRSVPAWVEKGYAVVLLDPPSDLPRGYTYKFRQSKKHLEDITKVTEYLAKRGMDKLTFLGMSRGSTSVVWLAPQINRLYLKNVVLTSLVPHSMKNFSLNKITQPLLIVHHTEDPCRVSPYSEVLKLKKRFTGSSRLGFVGVLGGRDPKAGTRKCSGKTQHGFLGREQDVVNAITSWIDGKDLPPKI